MEEREGELEVEERSSERTGECRQTADINNAAREKRERVRRER